MYDTLNRLTTIQAGSANHGYTYTGVNPLVQSLTRPNGSTTTYQYNGLNQLTEIVNKTSTDDILNQHVFTYNSLDLRGSETISGSVFPAMPSLPEETRDYDYNAVNQLLSITNPNLTFVYDDDGNMIQGYTPEGYVFTAKYDAEDQMTSLEYTDSSSVVHRTEYRYSGDGFLAVIRKFENSSLVDEIRIVRDGFLAVQERDENNTVEREYTWGLNLGGGISGLLNLKQGGQDYSYLYDGKGNVAAVLNSAQNVVAAYRYAPFGKLLAKTGSLDQPFGFSTKRYDSQTGLIYYGFRFYGPEIGRWTTRDPLGEAGGMNLYAFVGNNPVNWVDPWGLQYAESAGSWGQLAREALLVIEAGAATALGTTVAVVTSPVVVATGVTVGIVFYATDAAGPTEIPMPVLPNAATEDGEECEIGGKKAIDSGKAEPHGDAGRALEKVQKRIEELEKQLEGASKKERKRIKKKIERILKDARQKKKGGTHWRR